MNKAKSMLWIMTMFSIILLSTGVQMGKVIAQDQSCVESPVPRLAPRMTVVLVDTTSLPMLDMPNANGEVISTVSQGALLTVLDGPVCFEGQWMWQVNYVDRVGWVTENAQQTYVLQPFDETPGADSVLLDAPGLIAYSGVTFESPAELGSTISAQTTSIPGASQSRIFNFDDVPSDNLSPRIYVWRVDEYMQYGVYAEQNIMQLQELVNNGRELTGRQPAGSLPFLPQLEGGMTFAVQARGLAFRNGSGARYITHFSSTPDLVRPYSYVYTYQGLTNDGRYYVSIAIPLTSELPEHGMIDFSRPGVYDEYIEQIAIELDGFTSDQFEPALTILDEMVQSLEIADLSIDLPIQDDALPTRLAIGDRAQITPGVGNNLRSNPSANARWIATLQAGTIFTIVDGPVYAEGFIWYQINHQGMTGWTVETDGVSYFIEPIGR
jgi:Bacterial SH3 domain